MLVAMQLGRHVRFFLGGRWGREGGYVEKHANAGCFFMQKINARQSKRTYLVIGNLRFFRNLVIVGW